MKKHTNNVKTKEQYKKEKIERKKALKKRKK